MNYYQTIIINHDEIENVDNLITELKDDGILWILSDDLYKSNETVPKTFELIAKLTEKGLKLKNVVLWINRFGEMGSPVINIYKNILFFVKSENYYFNKDPIREKHIWKNVDWGKRPENYNPKGKDPSNVWILTKDDNNGKIIKYKPLTLDDIVKRCILCASKTDDKILLKVNTISKLTELNRGVEYG